MLQYVKTVLAKVGCMLPVSKSNGEKKWNIESKFGRKIYDTAPRRMLCSLDEQGYVGSTSF